MIDGPVTLGEMPVADTRNFSASCAAIEGSPAAVHGNGVAGRMVAECPDLELYVARVFGDSLVCRPEQVAQAISWLLDERVGLITMSFGLRHDREILREWCQEAVDLGICLVGAAPARGQGVYPSLYTGVVRATGDARCAPGEIAWLGSKQADFGGYPGEPGAPFAGASAGCASVAGSLARLAKEHPGLNNAQLLDALASAATYQGPERRGMSPVSPAADRESS
jgi:hypothetical protein